MGNCDGPSSHYLTLSSRHHLDLLINHNGEEATNLLSCHASLRNNTTTRVSYSCSTWSPPKISTTTRSRGASTRMSRKSVLDTVLPMTYTSGLSRKTRRNSYLRREVRVYPRRTAHRRNCWCRPGVRQARRCVGCIVCAEGACGTVVCRGSVTATVLNEDGQTTPPINLTFYLQPDVPPPLLSS